MKLSEQMNNDKKILAYIYADKVATLEQRANDLYRITRVKDHDERIRQAREVYAAKDQGPIAALDVEVPF